MNEIKKTMRQSALNIFVFLIMNFHYYSQLILPHKVYLALVFLLLAIRFCKVEYVKFEKAKLRSFEEFRSSFGRESVYILFS